ncbi:helix-turn-helix domain-containing protein [Hoeflea sp.]|uniref:helix-turn-helix domain-containing protein n=1 Tax=Hoeflea sp. TaxID=1940281 RepID=UPI0019AC344D|nr:helix-turn-helix domain-containing protein [Hoeflea sp.]MBC7285822.1 helix-turn-helix domain-containing protein [Hoeflea sp.]
MSELVRSPKQLGVALRRFRRTHGLTQTELAKRAGVRQGTVSQVETGLETVKLSTVMDLLRALDLEVVIQPRTKGSHSDIEGIF